MTSAGNIFAGGSVFHGQAGLRNHLASVRSDNVDPHNPISLGLGEHLDKPIGII